MGTKGVGLLKGEGHVGIPNERKEIKRETVRTHVYISYKIEKELRKRRNDGHRWQIDEGDSCQASQKKKKGDKQVAKWRFTKEGIGPHGDLLSKVVDKD